MKKSESIMKKSVSIMKKSVSMVIIMLMILQPCNVFALEANADKTDWFEWELPDDKASVGTAIDASYVLDAPAGKHGFAHREGEKIYFADGTNARFWGVNLSGAAIFEDKDSLDKIVDRAASMCYNVVRFHHMDAPWASENIFGQGVTQSTRKLNEEQLDKMFYLMAKLKERGIYFYVDLLVSRTAAAEDDNINSGDDLGNGWKYEALFDPYLIQLQKEYAEQLLSTVNPYTGLALKDDPAMVFVDILNENSLQGIKSGSIKQEYYRLQLQEKFNEWIKTNYSNKAALISAWEDLEEDEDYGSVFFYDDYADREEYSEARKNDTYRFLYSATSEFFTDFRNFLKNEIGVKCLITGTSIGGASNQMPATFYMTVQTGMDYIDRHNYVSHPYDYSFNDNMGYYDYSKAQSSIRGGGYLIYYPSFQRIYDMPYVIGEWLECIPNRFRAEANLMMASYACFQDWHPIQFNLLDDAVPDKNKALSGSFETYNDPVYTATAAAAGLIFHRHEVAESSEKYYLNKSYADVMSRKYTELGGDHDIAPYGKVGIMFGDIKYSAEDNSEDMLKALRTKAGNMEKQSKEIDWNYKDGIFKLDTEYTNGATGAVSSQKIELSAADFDIQNEFATVTLSSVTDEPLESSERMLLSTVARAENTGMTYSDDAQYITKKGTAPVLVEPVCGTVNLKTDRDIHVFALDSSGRRKAEISVTDSENGKMFEIGNNQSVYYEIVNDEPELQCTYKDGRLAVSGTIGGLNQANSRTTVTLYNDGVDRTKLETDKIADAIYAVKQTKTDNMGKYSAEFAVSPDRYAKYTVVVNSGGRIIEKTVEVNGYPEDVTKRSIVLENARFDASFCDENGSAVKELAGKVYFNIDCRIDGDEDISKQIFFVFAVYKGDIPVYINILRPLDENGGALSDMYDFAENGDYTAKAFFYDSSANLKPLDVPIVLD
ncbi:MAG: hypothetical protein ACI4DY_01040 [Monoglobaceae bacterium]